eukprot:c52682_g1_i1.p1 GENE.c52682_g1_i1~~c52682_g1_i1.p1  ORF type:complete len:521 (-),score=123.91 c52682_g1_i1:79-1608(-)
MVLIWLAVLVVLAEASSSAPEFGFLRTRSSDEGSHRYFVGIANFSTPNFPSGPQDSSYLPVHVLAVNSQLSFGCAAYETRVTGKAVVVSRGGNCTFAQKATVALNAGAAALIIVNTESKVFGMTGSLTHNIGIPVVLISKSASDRVQRADAVSIFVPTRGYVSMTVLWLLAVGTVFVGAWWAAPPFGQRAGEVQEYTEAPSSNDIPTVSISTKAAVGFIVFASAALLILFFFMKVLIWVVIIAFALGSISATYACAYHLINYLGCFRGSVLVKEFNVPWLGPTDPLSLVIIPASITLAVLFVVYRHSPFAWVMQDVMGISLCLMFFKSFRFPNMKTSSVLLVLAFVYDIFFVFITPAIFKGRSVMVEVATGGGSRESIPMLLKVPEPCDGCSPGMLGLGDIVLPGLFVSYTLAFDRANKLSHVHGYFMYNIIGYGLGLLITYLSLFLMHKGQPALLYLVPMTLGVTCLLAAWRGHLKQLWNNTPNEHSLLPVVQTAQPLELQDDAKTGI